MNTLTLRSVARAPIAVHPVVGAVALAGPRLARLAERRAFVITKHDFLTAVEGLEGSHAEWVRRQIRAAEQPSDLWLLRGTVFEALADAGQSALEPLLRASLDTLFRCGAPATDFLSSRVLTR